ncbi:MAG: class I SAM-dependent methyltransferase [Gemmatimonadaceae bacterium]
MPSREPPALECPLCGTPGAESHFREASREYWRCGICELVFLSPSQRLSREDEIARYALHQNSFGDPEYRKFLSRLAEPVIERVRVGSSGLDYGCGQAPVLALILSESGRPTAAYDPVFRPDEQLLEATYDFVTCSEVVEHVHDPHALLDRFARLVRSGGKLAIMTELNAARVPFGEWWYRRDPTHVCFYGESTMRWIARERGWGLEMPARNVTIFTAYGDGSKGS